MRHFQHLGEWDATPLALAIARKPDLWNQHTFRTTYENTPHANADDILLRYSAPKVTNPDKVRNDFELHTYPAWHELPEARPVIFNLLRRFEGIALGRVVISRIPPGGVILPHADNYGDYVQDGARFHAVVQGLPGSKFHCGGETVQMLSGSVWWFDHKEMHSVENHSADDRVHLMIDIRSAPCST
jgi:Aspartyl/Asparaginyl beta-hydroxylase